MKELKPCPFCGSPAEKRGTKWAMCSGNCPGRGFVAFPDEWNRRPIEDELAEVLSEVLDSMHDLSDGCGCCSERSGYEYESFQKAEALLKAMGVER